MRFTRMDLRESRDSAAQTVYASAMTTSYCLSHLSLAETCAEENLTEAHELDPYALSLFDGGWHAWQELVRAEALYYLESGLVECDACAACDKESGR